MAIKQLEYLDEVQIEYDTLKYLSIKYPILEGLGMYKEALDTYKDFSNRLETINSTKFEQKSQSMEERHRVELEAERAAREHSKTVWALIMGGCALLLVIIILILALRSYRIKKDLALEQAHATELENENLTHRVAELEVESDGLKELLQSQTDMPDEVRKTVQKRIEMLNSYLASRISDHKEFEKAYDEWVAEHTANTEEFMNSNRLAFQASHPAFIKYFEDHGLTEGEINYVCLYAIGLRGKDVGNYMKKRSHVNISSEIRSKLGIDRHETNIGIYVRKLLKNL